LIVEDERKLAQVLSSALQAEHYDVVVATTGEDGFYRANAELFDLVVLDLMLPGRSGLEILHTLRQRRIETPVLILTARDGLDDRVLGLDLGADDYLVKPFALSEFEARVRALLRRRTTQGVPELKLGRLRLDLPRRRAHIDEAPLELTPREFGLLETLVARLDRVMSREQLIDALCTWDTSLTDNGLDIAVHRLRRKLENSGVHVRTVRGLGYLLEVDDAPAA